MLPVSAPYPWIIRKPLPVPGNIVVRVAKRIAEVETLEEFHRPLGVEGFSRAHGNGHHPVVGIMTASKNQQL